MEMTPYELLRAALDGQRMLFTIVNRRLKSEEKRALVGKPIPNFIRQETQSLARIHDAFDDGLRAHQKLLAESHQPVDNAALYNVADMLGRQGLLPPITGPTAIFINRIEKSIGFIKAQWSSRQQREENNGQI